MKKVLFLLFFLTTITIIGQVSLTVSIRQPTPSSINIWQRDPSILQLFVRNSTGRIIRNVYFTFTIYNENNNPIAYTEKNGFSSPKFTIPAGPPYGSGILIINGPQLVKSTEINFNNNRLKNNLINTNSLPEGNYQLCIKAFDERGNNITNSEEFCTYFSIRIPDPPILINPLAADTLLTNFPTFSWQPVTGYYLRQAIKYKIKIVPLFAGQNGRYAIESNPVLLEKTITSPLYTYLPSDASFSFFPDAVGFAWQVQALTSSGEPATKLEGKSEIRVFYKKKKTKLSFNLTIAPPELNQPENSAEIKTKTPTFSFSSNILGKNEYLLLKVVPVKYFQSVDNALEDNFPVYSKKYKTVPKMFFPSTTIKFKNNKKYAWQVQVVNKNTKRIIRKSEIRTFVYQHSGPAMASVSGKLFYEYSDPGEYTGKPLKRTNFKLVKKYFMKYNFHRNNTNSGDQTKSGNVLLPQNYLKSIGIYDADIPVAFASTDDEGSFSFSFIAMSKSNTIIKKNIGYYASNAGGFQDYYLGDIYFTYRIILDNQHLTYYLNPTKDIIVQPDESVNVGNIFSYVRSYSLTVTVLPTELIGSQLTHEPIPNMIVYLLRKNRPALVPEDEAKPKPVNPIRKKGIEVIAVDTTGGFGNKLGKVTFKHLVKNAGVNDNYYLYAESNPGAGKENYKVLKPAFIKFNFKDKAFFNNEYIYQKEKEKIYAVPKAPEVEGKVLREDSGLPLAGAKVLLRCFHIKDNPYWNDERHWDTYSSGLFKFKDLDVELNEHHKIAGPARKLRISKYGYTTREIPIVGTGLRKALTLGEKWRDNAIALKPNGAIVGQIVNENGNGIKSKVILMGGESVDAVPSFDWSNFTFGKSSFKLRSPLGKQTIIIDPTPYSPQYFKDTLFINVVENPTDVGKIILKRKSHKLAIKTFYVTVKNGFVVPGSEKSIPKAHVILRTEDGTLIADEFADQKGNAFFDFFNSSNSFIVTVKSPSNNLDLETRVVSIKIPESKNYIWKKIYLNKATRISGFVYVGKGNKPVKNAKVYLRTYQSNNNPLETFTKKDGSFVLHNVPIANYQTFTASKSQSNTIGDNITLNITGNGNSNVVFHLKVYNDMDITHLLGFPIEVNSLNETNGKVTISGNFVKLDSLGNQIFSSITKSIPFTNVAIKQGNRKTKIFNTNVPVAIPVKLPLKTDVNNLALKIYKTFDASLKDKKLGIELLTSNSGNGALAGKVFVGEGNFSLSNDNFDLEEDGFYLKYPKTGNLTIPTITSTKKVPFNITNGIPVVNSKGNGIKYKLYSYRAESGKGKSFISKDTIKFNTEIHTKLINVTPEDIKLNIGEVKILKNKIIPISGKNKKIEITLDDWKIEGSKWQFNGYLKIHNGTLHTNIVDIPIKEMNIEPEKLSGGKFDLKRLTLPGNLPLHIVGNPVLNYSLADNYWFLFVGKAEKKYSSYLSNLPGMTANSKILIDAINLTSKGGKAFSPVYGQDEIKIYKVGYLSASSIESFKNYTEISGLRFKIPGFSQSMRIRYGKDNSGKLKLRLVPSGIAMQANGVQMDFGFNQSDQQTQKLDNSGFIARGRVYEHGKFSLNSWLHHTVDSTSILVETKPKQTLPIGGKSTYLANITGNMKVEGNSWNNFTFSGDMTGTKGVTDDKKRTKFIVEGEIKANGQELGIKNINTPFGDMSWTYEFEHSRLIGTLTFHKNISGLHIDGQAESLVDPDGWYLIAGGKMKLPGLGPAQAAILIGDYPRMTQSVRDIFATSSYKKGLPASFETQISGFLFSGAIAIPVIIPDIDLDLVILYAKLGIHAGGDARVWMNFDGSGNEYGMGLLAFVHAFVEAGSITCTNVAADATVELGAEGNYQTASKTFNIDGCGSFNLGIHVIQKTPTPVGCKGTIFNEGFDFGIRSLLHLDSNGNKKLNFELGTCSGN